MTVGNAEGLGGHWWHRQEGYIEVLLNSRSRAREIAAR